MSLFKRIRDVAIETLIAVILVTAFVVYLFKFPKESRPNWGLVAFIVNTAIVFGFLVSWFRHLRKNVLYWAVLAVLLLCHIAIYVFAHRRIEQIPLVFYLLTNSAELAFFSHILQKLPSFPERSTKS